MMGIDILTFSFAALLAVSFFGFYLRGMTGTGTGTVMMALATMVIDPKIAVVIVSFLSLVSGLVMLPLDRVTAHLPLLFWLPIAVTMSLAGACGAWALGHVPPDLFRLILGGAFLLLAVWFFVQPYNGAGGKAPPRASALSLVVAAFSGFCGGFMAVNAAPLVAYFGRLLDKAHLRRLFILIFLPAAGAQTATYAATGLLTREALAYSLCLLPMMALGLWMGNRGFRAMPEQFFRHVLAALVFVSAVRLIWQGSGI